MPRSSIAIGLLLAAIVLLQAGTASARASRRVRRVHHVALRGEVPPARSAMLAPAPLRPAAVGGLNERLQQSTQARAEVPPNAADPAEPGPALAPSLTPSLTPAAPAAASPIAGAPPSVASGSRAVAGVGMKLAQQLSAPYLRDGQRRIVAAFQDDPVLTGILVGGVAIVGIGAYVGWQASREGRVEANPSISLGEVRLRLSGGYDFANGAWQGVLGLDLSRLVDNPLRGAPLPVAALSPAAATVQARQ